MAKISRITPMFGVKDVAKTLAFYEKYLGFKASIKTKEYGYLSNGCANIRVGRNVNPPSSGVSCVIDTENVDGLYAQLEPLLKELPPGRATSPKNQDYGMRDFHVVDPDNITIYFGEPIPGFDVQKYVNENQ